MKEAIPIGSVVGRVYNDSVVYRPAAYSEGP